jgi:hypothetical protein
MVNTMSEERGKDRSSYEQPELVSVKCRIQKESDEDRVCVLNVFDSSKSGIALLIAPKDADLLEFIEEGDKICDMSFFGIGAQIKEDGIIKHITQVDEGKYKGYYILGIEAQDV